MSTPIPTSTLDHILAHQITVAWAGEGRCEPPRLGWWQTDFVDPAGGGDLFARLTPRTAAWAALEAVREAALRADAQARRLMSDADKLRTLFFLGFDLDEKLADRLDQLKRSGEAPDKALPIPIDFALPFSADRFVEAIRATGGEHTVVPGGRQLRGAPPPSLELLAARLTAALVPLADRYPLPFFKIAP